MDEDSRGGGRGEEWEKILNFLFGRKWKGRFGRVSNEETCGSGEIRAKRGG